jgi:hypothetical protein
MKLTQILDRPIAYHRVFVTLTGSVKAAIMLSQALYWQPRAKQKDGWWYKSAEEWEEETGLTRHEQQTARKDCEKYLLSDLRGVPATLYWKVDEEALSTALFDENSKTSFTETVKLDLRNQSNINKNTETTSETTKDHVAKNATLDQSKTTIENQIFAGVSKVIMPTIDDYESRIDVAAMQICKYGQDLDKLAAAVMTALKIIPTTNKDLKSWAAGLRDLKNSNITPDYATAAAKKLLDAGMTVSNPYALKSTALSLMAKPLQPHVEYSVLY